MVKTRSRTAVDRGVDKTPKINLAEIDSDFDDDGNVESQSDATVDEDVETVDSDVEVLDDKSNKNLENQKSTKRSSKKLSTSTVAGNKTPLNNNNGDKKKNTSNKSKSVSSSKDQKKGIKRSSSNKKGEITKRGTRPIHSYFKGRSPSTSPSPEKESKKRKLDPGVRAFLFSGIPETVAKAQKVVEKKKEDDEFLSTVDFFPKIHHIPRERCNEGEDVVDGVCKDGHFLLPLPKGFTVVVINSIDTEDTTDIHSKLSLQDHFKSNSANGWNNGENSNKNEFLQLCCNFTSTFQTQNKKHANMTVEINQTSMPWISRFKVEKLKDIVCDKEALSKLTTWLKQWKSDIKDDGGMSRKIEKKKRRHESDSDFVTSDEEEGEFKKKSVLLSGPPGCGKTTAVYLTAQHYGFHVVEVNFSKRRPGKDVLQQVEEAVLSQRVKDSANCLLLFEDINLLDVKEDEGFHAAVAQLITTAVRPIVMTITTSLEYYASALDSKIEKKDPLRIHFQYPKSSQIIRKLSIPIFKSILESENNSSAKDHNDEDEECKPKIPSNLLRVSDSIARHTRGDIRQTINQLQFIFTKGTFSFINSSSSEYIFDVSHIHIDQQLGSVLDFDFVRPSVKEMYYDENDVSEYGESQEDDDDVDINISVKARKIKGLQKLQKMAKMLEHISDIDFVNGMNKCIFSDSLFNDLEEEQEMEKHKRNLRTDYLNFACRSSISDAIKSGVDFTRIQPLILSNDNDINAGQNCYKLIDELSDYCDNIYADGGWEIASYIRSIIKRSKIDSIGSNAKRNGRLSYFNRLDRNFVDRVCETFGFNKEIEIAHKRVKYY